MTQDRPAAAPPLHGLEALARYWADAAWRVVATMDTLRERAANMRQHEAAGMPPPPKSCSSSSMAHDPTRQVQSARLMRIKPPTGGEASLLDMDAKNILWKRMACGVLLAVFTLVAAAGTACTGQKHGDEHGGRDEACNPPVVAVAATFSGVDRPLDVQDLPPPDVIPAARFSWAPAAAPQSPTREARVERRSPIDDPFSISSRLRL